MKEPGWENAAAGKRLYRKCVCGEITGVLEALARGFSHV